MSATTTNWFKRSRQRAWKILKSATFWSAVAAVAAVLAVLLPLRDTAKPEPKPARILYYPETSANIINEAPRSVNTRTRLLFDGKEEHDLRLFVFWIQYKGSKSILPQDFAEPIRATVPSDRQILILQEAADDVRGPGTYLPGRIGLHLTGQRIKCQPRRIDDTHFEFPPILMNPGEWFAVEFYTAAAAKTPPEVDSRSTPGTTPQIEQRIEPVKWECHVAGVICPPEMGNMFEDFTDSPSFWSFLPGAAVSFESNETYAVCLLSTLNVVLLMSLAFAANLNRSTKVAQLWFLALAVVLSVPSIGTIVGWVSEAGNYDGFLEGQPFHARAIVWTDIALIVLLAWLAIRATKRRRGAARLSDSKSPDVS